MQYVYFGEDGPFASTYCFHSEAPLVFGSLSLEGAASITELCLDLALGVVAYRGNKSKG